MPLDDALHDREADAVAIVFLRSVQSLEHAEELVDVLHVEANPVVLDEVDGLPGFASSAHLDSGHFP